MKTRIALFDIGKIGPRATFARRIAELELFARTRDHVFRVADDLRALRISFAAPKKNTWLAIEDIATLAVIVRKVAEAGRTVTITLGPTSTGPLPRLHNVLERLGFHDAFLDPANEQPWCSNVQFVGERTHISQAFNISDKTTSYLRLQWLTQEDFAFDSNSDIWREKPHVQASLARQFREVLQQQGFAGTRIIETLTDTMFLELGWNVVLHSDRRPGAGVGVFCAQILRRVGGNPDAITPELRFCIADAGRGIPSTLRDMYRKNTNRDRMYHEEYKVGEDAAIIRFALDRDSTSRPVFPSDIDKEGFRGLAHVAAALGDAGEMQVRSDSGAVALRGSSDGPEAFPKDVPRNAAVIGTQVIGTLRRKVRQAAGNSLIVNRTLPEISIELVCGPDGSCPEIATAERAVKFAAGFRPKTETVVVDVGYGCLSVRELEFLCKNIIPRLPRHLLIFWNVNPDWAEFGELERWFSARIGKDASPALFVRGHGDARVFGTLNDATHLPKKSWWRDLISISRLTENPAQTSATIVRLSCAEFVTVNHEVNSRYLEEGFKSSYLSDTGESKNIASGFYIGTIHLLKAETVSHFFSLLKNLSAGRRTANLNRWTEALVGAVSRLRELQFIPEERLVLLGFTGTVREVLYRLARALPLPCRAYALLTFDIATREELETVIAPGDRVLFVTDVILRGTLINAIHELVSRVGGEVVGVASLFDRREETTEAEGWIAVGREQTRRLPHVSCGRFAKAGAMGELIDREYWVDPVSLVPNRQNPWTFGKEVDEKIESTLRIIHTTGAALCGHIIDGARHTSVFVRVKDLIANATVEIKNLVDQVIDDRLRIRQWADFRPTVVLFPSGISRIENVGAMPGAGITVYETAVKSYVELLKQKWPGLQPVEVPRAFDPGGSARCARNVDVPIGTNVADSDIIVADDGIWRGRTAAALIQIALNLKAKRILITPLLARLAPTDTAQLEAQHSVWSDSRSSNVEICYAFPLLLPIPYYGASDCPFETTISRMKDRCERMPDELAEIATEVISGLRGQNPVTCQPKSADYTSTWVRARVYVELATVQQEALESLRKLIEGTRESEKLLALFNLFVEEWRLLGFARLRQEITRALLVRTRETSLAPESRNDVRIAALTVLRTLFREEFIDLLPKLVTIALSDLNVLRRLVMQVGAFNIGLQRRDNCIRFLEAVSEGSLVQAQLPLATVSKCLALGLRDNVYTSERTERECAVELYNLVRSNRASAHAIRSFLNLFAITGKSIHEWGGKEFRLFYKEWETTHVPLLTNQMLPMLNRIRHLLLRTATGGLDLLPEDLRFLRSGVQTLTMDVATLSQGLKLLQAAPESPLLQRSVVIAAGHLWSSLLAPGSKVVGLLEQMRCASVVQVLTRFGENLDAQFRSIGQPVNIQIEGLDTIDQNALLFAPQSVIDLCTGNVADNLRRYAFNLGYEQLPENASRRIQLHVAEVRSESNEPMVELSVKNNGTPLRNDLQIGHGGQHANAELSLFGGRYQRPQNLSEQRWQVLQVALFLLW